jgi:hypothetical protein
VVQVVGDGSNTGLGALDDGTGPIFLSNIIPNTAIPAEVIPKFVDVFTYAFETELVNLCLNQRNFGLSFSQKTYQWNIILDTNLDLVNPFSLTNQGNVDNVNLDASWLVAFTWTGKSYKVRHRQTDYIFESDKETGFFVDENTVNFDYTSNSVVRDQIKVLAINQNPNSSQQGLSKDYVWQIDKSVVEADGFVEPKKVKISFYDRTETGEIADPDAFTNVVSPTTTGTVIGLDGSWQKNKFVYFKKMADGLRYQLADAEEITAYSNPDNVPLTARTEGDLYYFYDVDFNVVKRYSLIDADVSDPWVYESDYTVYPGRSNLKFHYVHNSSEDRRIDPSKSNIIDIYLLTAGYDTEYRSWLLTGVGTEPMAPTSQSLEQSYSGILEPIKTISDELVFQPVKYKVLFGYQASENLQATFKAVKNTSRPVSDNEIKSRVLTAIEDFFRLENWDFGQTFYFSELATYVMNIMTPDITNFVIVPKSNNAFGSLYEVSCLSNEIFINGASAADIEVIDAITASQLKTTNIVSGT